MLEAWANIPTTVPANPGVNPSLTIAAMTEHAMSQVPARAS
jgi:hypothetical protein